jgi:hypothetical protein
MSHRDKQDTFMKREISASAEDRTLISQPVERHYRPVIVTDNRNEH